LSLAAETPPVTTAPVNFGAVVLAGASMHPNNNAAPANE